MLARRMVLTLGLALTGATVGCGGGGGGGTGTTPVLTTVQLTPASPSIAVSGTVTMVAVPLDQTGTAIAGLAGATFSSGDATKATVNASSGVVTGVSAGAAVITASITSGALTKSATQTVTVTGVSNTVTITGTPGLVWSPSASDVNSVATVTWVLNGIHSVIFDAVPAGAVPGNIAVGASGTDAQKTLTVAGVYNFHCSVHPATMIGTVTVH